MRTRVCVDGFNLYYGALKGTPFRWLDPVRLSALLLPRECAIDRLRYFTARVSGKVDPRAPARQRIYLNALATLPEVEIHYGRFLAKTAWRPLANLPVAGRRIFTDRFHARFELRGFEPMPRIHRHDPSRAYAWLFRRVR